MLQHYAAAEVASDAGWIAALRFVMGAPELQGEYLKVNAAMQRALATAIADRAGLDVERDMLPQVLAGAVTAAAQVAVGRWLYAEPATSLRDLVRRALQQLGAACAGAVRAAAPPREGSGAD